MRIMRSEPNHSILQRHIIPENQAFKYKILATKFAKDRNLSLGKEKRTQKSREKS